MTPVQSAVQDKESDYMNTALFCRYITNSCGSLLSTYFSLVFCCRLGSHPAGGSHWLRHQRRW